MTGGPSGLPVLYWDENYTRHIYLKNLPVDRKILFVCSRNRIRSLTAERVFGDTLGWDARSVGTQPNARIIVTAGHIGWADLIVCMEKKHLNILRRKFSAELVDKKLLCLHIPDEYKFMEEALIDELETRLDGILEID